MDGDVGKAGWSAVEGLLAEAFQSGQPALWFQKHLGSLVAEHQWDVVWPPVTDKSRFGEVAADLYRAYTAIEYARQRQAQLEAAGHALWVYRCHDPIGVCAGLHAVLDGLVLPADHAFWSIWAPPNAPFCTCSVTGARSPDASRRLGGSPEKSLPTWWDDVEHVPDASYFGGERPSVRELGVALLALSDR